MIITKFTTDLIHIQTVDKLLQDVIDSVEMNCNNSFESQVFCTQLRGVIDRCYTMALSGHGEVSIVPRVN